MSLAFVCSTLTRFTEPGTHDYYPTYEAASIREWSPEDDYETDVSNPAELDAVAPVPHPDQKNLVCSQLRRILRSVPKFCLMLHLTL